MRNCIKPGYLSKFQYPNIQTVLHCFTFKSLTNMHKNTVKSKSDTDANSNNASPNMLERKEKELDVVNKHEMKDNEDISAKKEPVMPENFSEMERQIFLAHKNAVEVK